MLRRQRWREPWEHVSELLAFMVEEPVRKKIRTSPSRRWSFPFLISDLTTIVSMILPLVSEFIA